MRSFFGGRKRFSDLSESEILALAISSEEDDARIYRGFAEQLRSEYPASAKVFDGMALEEDLVRVAFDGRRCVPDVARGLNVRGQVVVHPVRLVLEVRSLRVPQARRVVPATEVDEHVEDTGVGSVRGATGPHQLVELVL